MDAAEQRRLAQVGVAAARSKLTQLEEGLAQVERQVFADLDAIEQRLAAMESGLPSSRELQERRYAAIYRLRAQGWSITAIARRVSMSRSRVAAIVQQADVPTPPWLIAVDGRRYPARRNGARRERNTGALGSGQ